MTIFVYVYVYVYGHKCIVICSWEILYTHKHAIEIRVTSFPPFFTSLYLNSYLPYSVTIYIATYVYQFIYAYLIKIGIGSDALNYLVRGVASIKFVWACTDDILDLV